MPVRTLGPRGGGFGGGPASIGGRKECQRGRWAPKGGGLSRIDWRKERVPARTLGPEGGWIVMFHIGWGGEQTTVYKGVETFP